MLWRKGRLAKQTQFEVDVGDKGEAGERTHEEGVGAGENKLVDVDVEAADGNSCSGSVVVDEEFSGGWLEDSIVIDIGIDAADWGDELDGNAAEKQIADGVVADSLENGTSSGFEGSMFGFISGLDRFDSTGWDCDFDADAVGSFIATELDAAGLACWLAVVLMIWWLKEIKKICCSVVLQSGHLDWIL